MLKWKDCPILLFGVEPIAVAFPEPVASVGRAEEERAAAAGGKHGSDDLVPGIAVDESRFIDDHEIEASAAQLMPTMGAANLDHPAFWQIDSPFCQAYFHPFQVFDRC